MLEVLELIFLLVSLYFLPSFIILNKVDDEISWDEFVKKEQKEKQGQILMTIVCLPAALCMR